ncbi:hypothetical protein [Leucobacter sp. VD1]|uniref:hypothetical protein n=1 Tax=Leucobacter sp. VD1 TaxID=3080381 RepID=UPI003015BED8
MSIREQITVDIATVEINDEYRVELAQLRKVQDYSPEQARALADELIERANAADEMIADHMHEQLQRMTASTPRTITGEVVL